MRPGILAEALLALVAAISLAAAHHDDEQAGRLPDIAIEGIRPRPEP